MVLNDVILPNNYNSFNDVLVSIQSGILQEAHQLNTVVFYYNLEESNAEDFDQHFQSRALSFGRCAWAGQDADD